MGQLVSYLSFVWISVSDNDVQPTQSPPKAGQFSLNTESAFDLQNWAETFRSSPDLHGVTEVYDEHKARGVDFPVLDLETMTPIITPQRVQAQVLCGRIEIIYWAFPDGYCSTATDSGRTQSFFESTTSAATTAAGATSPYNQPGSCRPASIPTAFDWTCEPYTRAACEVAW